MERNEIIFWTVVSLVFVGTFGGFQYIDDPDNLFAWTCFILWIISGTMLYLRFPTFRRITNVIALILFILFMEDQIKKRNNKR